MNIAIGAAVVHGHTAYFSCSENVYSLSENKWTRLQPCRYRYFGLAVINDQLTTIGGWDREKRITTNSLLSLSGQGWRKVFHPMPTSRVAAAVATTPTHLVVAGEGFAIFLSTVEVLNTNTFQWFTARELPQAVGFPQITLCDECFYLSDGYSATVFSCSVEDLLKSCKPTFTNSSDGGSVWTRLANIPVPHSSLTTLKGCVLAVGGWDGGNQSGTIRCYNVATNSWSVIGEMPTPRHDVLTAVLPSNELVVVGGSSGNITEIGTAVLQQHYYL